MTLSAPQVLLWRHYKWNFRKWSGIPPMQFIVLVSISALSSSLLAYTLIVFNLPLLCLGGSSENYAQHSCCLNFN